MKSTSEILKNNDICVFYKNQKFINLKYIGIDNDNYIFSPIYESADLIKENIELGKDTVNQSVFIKDYYKYWPTDIIQKYTDYQLQLLNKKTVKLNELSSTINTKFKDFLKTDEYNKLFESNKKLSESLNEIKDIIKSYGR